VYQFDRLGEEGGEVSSTDYPDFGMKSDPAPVYFRAKPLENLILVDELDSFAPIIDAKVANVMHSDSPQIFTACGRGSRSSLKMMRHGLEVEELVSSPLGFQPTGIWSTKLTANGESRLPNALHI
jgi:splicing factor 3B subunit 3